MTVLHRDERGSAVVELTVLGTLIFGVLVHAVVLFGVIQRSSLAASAAAREVGRAAALADDDTEAAARAQLAIAQAEQNHGLEPGSLDVQVSGTVARGEKLRIFVRTVVPVAQIPFLGSVWSSLTIPVEATFVARVDRYRGFDK